MELMEGGKATAPVEDHPGCVKRVLNFKDRLLILQALNRAAAQGGDAKTLGRLVKLQDILDQEGVDDYYAVMDKEYGKKISAWGLALERHIRSAGADPDPGPKPQQAHDETLGR